MNLFETYTEVIKNKIIKHSDDFNLTDQIDLKNIIVENPPEQFNYDLSSNAALVMAKLINENPRKIAEKLKKILQKEIKDFSNIDVAGPGFLNFQISIKTWNKIIASIIKEKKKYGSKKKNKK